MTSASNFQRDLILSVNSGSSSLKITLFSILPQDKRGDKNVKLVLNGSLSSISSPPVQAKLQSPTDEKVNKSEEVGPEQIKNHESAFEWFLKNLKEVASIDRERIGWICHRVVHGGDYSKPVVIDQDSYHHIEALSDLAPLHNGPALSVVKACIHALPNAASVAYFDSTFHRSIPPPIYSYAIDQKVAKERGLKKYGFHGISYSYILKAVGKYLSKPTESLNLIVLHLGSGASACAIKSGQSLDTSMGLTPVEGLPGATRSGAIDPSLIFHYTNKAGRITHEEDASVDVDVTLAEEILNKKSGWKSITGTTNFGEVASKADLKSTEQPTHATYEKNPHRLAYDIFLDRVYNYIGAYHLKLKGEVDAIVFAGAIGEKSQDLRRSVAEHVRCLGYQDLEEEKNGGVDGRLKGQVNVVQVSKEGSGEKRLLVCKTNEQFEMANDCASDLSRFAGEGKSMEIDDSS